MHPRPPYADISSSTTIIDDVAALCARYGQLTAPPRFADPDPLTRWDAARAHREQVEQLQQDVHWLGEEIRTDVDDPRRAAIDDLYPQTYALVGRAQQRERAAENAYLRGLGLGVDVDRRLQVERSVFSAWRRPSRPSRPCQTRRTPPRRRGAGRPRAQAARSSSRSGDSGEDGPAGHRTSDVLAEVVA